MMIRAIDAAILKACTKFSHAIQRAIGLTNYFIAKLGLAVAATDVVIEIINYFHQFLHSKIPTWLVGLYVLILCVAVRDTFNLTKADEHLWSGSRTKPRGLLSYIENWYWRPVWLGWMLFDLCVSIFYHPGQYWFLEFVSMTFFSTGNTIFHYFVAVDPLPPGKSLLRQWIESFRRQPELAPEAAR